MNIAKILENVPEGTELYSTLIGECKFVEVENSSKYPIKVRINDNAIDDYECFTKDGKYFANEHGANGECLLFPSKENRDWSKFKVEKPSYKFKPFDKVLVRRSEITHWICNYFSHMCENYYVCLGGDIWTYCIPYNDETKHLVGTSKAFV